MTDSSECSIKLTFTKNIEADWSHSRRILKQTGHIHEEYWSRLVTFTDNTEGDWSHSRRIL